MSRLILLKLGGSLITDKRREATLRPSVLARLAWEVRAALDADPALRLVIGHGSGSFGHVVAKRYRVRQGCRDWRGYALTGAAAARLNRLVVDALLDAGVPVVSLQPSASARCENGRLVDLAIAPVQGVLARGLVPVVFGDVALDGDRGSTIISTEQVLGYLVPHLRPQRILLAGEVDGVYTGDPLQDAQARPIPAIHSGNMEEVRGMLGGSHGVDVTGGMWSKVTEMYALVQAHPGLTVQLLSGLRPSAVKEALLADSAKHGTLIYV